LLLLETPSEVTRPTHDEAPGAAKASEEVRLPDMAMRPPAAPTAEVYDMGRGSPENQESTQHVEMEIGDEESSAADDWYSQDDFQANKSLEQGAESSTSRSQVPSWASKLGKKAGKIGNAAKTAIMSEAKLLSADAKDLAMGVREGASMTIQDTKSLSKQLQRDAKQLSKQSTGGWRGLWPSRAGSKPGAGESELADPTPAVASSDLGTASSSSAPAAEDQVSRQPSVNKDESGKMGAKGVAVVGALKETWSATAEVSSQMWRDLKEAKDEAIVDLRTSMQEIRQGVQSLRPAAGPSAGLAREGSKDDSATQDLDANAEEAKKVKPPAPPTEALDMLLSGALDDEPESRTVSDRRPDEQGPNLSSKVEEMARATSNMSAKIWRKTELSIKQALPSMQRIPSGGKEFDTESRGDEDRQSQSHTPRGENEELAAPSPCGTPRGTSGADAARRARKLGGKIAKKSREISGNMLKQAGAVASMRPKSGNFSNIGSGDASKGEEDEGIFEIGSDEEEELFAGDGNSVTGSDLVSAEDTLSQNSPRSNPSAPSAPIAAVSAEQDSSRKSALDDPFAEIDLLATSAPEPSIEAKSSNTSATLLASEMEASTSANTTVLEPPPPQTEKTTEVGDLSAVRSIPPPSASLLDVETKTSDVPPPKAKVPEEEATESAAEQMRRKMEARKAVVEAAERVDEQMGSTAEADSDDWFDDMIADSNASQPDVVSSVPAVVDTSGASSKTEIDFLAAAEKELEDLFGDD
jgi:hypothetical protein